MAHALLPGKGNKSAGNIARRMFRMQQGCMLIMHGVDLATWQLLKCLATDPLGTFAALLARV